MHTKMIKHLESIMSSDTKELQNAARFFQDEANTNFITFMKTLSDVLAQQDASEVARTAAGLLIKKNLTAKDEILKLQHKQRWLDLPKKAKSYIKKKIISAMGTETCRPSVSPQCVAYVALAELPLGRWTHLMPMLIRNVTDEQSSEQLKVASLEAIGYICEDIDSKKFGTRNDPILKAIIPGMQSTELNVRLAAVQAFRNAVKITKNYFKKQHQRDIVMKAVSEAAQSSDTQIRIAGLQSLVEIVSLHYHIIRPYMRQKLFPITLEAMTSDIDEIVLQGIRYWSVVCVEETKLRNGNSAARSRANTFRFSASDTMSSVIRILTDKLTKLDPNGDEFDWNPTKAASMCLQLLTKCYKDEVLPHLLPFIEVNIHIVDWRYRGSALMAFRSILKELDIDTLRNVVDTIMLDLLESIFHPNIGVTVTAASTFGVLSEICPMILMDEQYLDRLIICIFFGLHMDPLVVVNICWIIINLFKAAYLAENVPQPETYRLSKCYDKIVYALVAIMCQEKPTKHNMQAAVYEAAMVMVVYSPKDCYDTAKKIALIILKNTYVQMIPIKTYILPTAEYSRLIDIESLSNLMMRAIFIKAHSGDLIYYSNFIVHIIHKKYFKNRMILGAVQNDDLMTIDTLVSRLRLNFHKYVPMVMPLLHMNLKNISQHDQYGEVVKLVIRMVSILKHQFGLCSVNMMDDLLENYANISADSTLRMNTFTLIKVIVRNTKMDSNRFLNKILNIMHVARESRDHRMREVFDGLIELKSYVL